MSDTNKFQVEVLDFFTDKVVKTMKVNSLASAMRVDSGLNINLNHERFWTRIVDENTIATGDNV